MPKPLLPLPILPANERSSIKDERISFLSRGDSKNRPPREQDSPGARPQGTYRVADICVNKYSSCMGLITNLRGFRTPQTPVCMWERNAPLCLRGWDVCTQGGGT